MENKRKGTLYACLSAIIFGLTPVLASLTFDMGSNAITLTFYRNAMAVPVLFVILLIRKINLKITGKEMVQLILVSIFFSVTTTFILYDAYQYIGIGLSTTLHFLYPMFTVLIEFIFFKDKMNKIKIVSLIIATVGVALATGTGSSFALKGIAIAIASAVTYAGYLISLEKTGIKKMDSMKAMFYMCIINSIAASIIDIPMKDIVFGLSPEAMVMTFVLAVTNSAVAYVLLIVGVKMIGAGNAAIFSMLEPVSGVAAGIIFLNETLPLNKLTSCVIILFAIMLPIITEEKNGF